MTCLPASCRPSAASHLHDSVNGIESVKQHLPKSAIVAFVIVDALIIGGFIYYILSG